MSQCRKLEKQLEKGQFGENFTDLPANMQTHLETCEDCQQLLEMLHKTEKEMMNLEHAVPDAQSSGKDPDRC